MVHVFAYIHILPNQFKSGSHEIKLYYFIHGKLDNNINSQTNLPTVVKLVEVEGNMKRPHRFLTRGLFMVLLIFVKKFAYRFVPFTFLCLEIQQ